MLSPDIFILQGAVPCPFCYSDAPHPSEARSSLNPFLTGIGITAEIGAGVEGIVTLCMVYPNLSLKVTKSLETIAKPS